METHTNRRNFIGQAALAAGAVGLPFVAASCARAAAPAAQDSAGTAHEADAWLTEVRGEHRCLFDFNKHLRGAGLDHMFNYVNTYETAYGAAPGSVGMVGTFYGIGPNSSIMLGFDDAIWEKYQLGAYSGLNDANGRPYTRNVFNSPTDQDDHLLAEQMGLPMMDALKGALAACSVSALQARGAKFIMCANALGAWTYELEALGKGAQPAIMEELQAHLLPGVTVVPAMVIAIEKAQAAGIRYNKQ